MTTSKQIKFKIDHIDPMGQGVCKQDGQIYFIPKTLPDEVGTATVTKSSKGVNFANLNTLINESTNRVKPFCKHYEQCQGCHFQHCSYEVELEFKKNALAKHLQNLDFPEIQIIKCSDRKNYRNRIQLHYNKKQNKLGFINARTKQIVPIETCPISNKDINEKLSQLVINWKSLAPKGQGHVEISNQISWDQRYASDGFSQVNEEINNQLKQILNAKVLSLSPSSTLDLFSGKGNLSESITNKVLIDYSPYQIENYYQLDLFDPKSLNEFKEKNSKTFDLIILDPPRKGFPLLNDWLNAYSANNIIYVSCNPATLSRDLSTLKEYKITQLFLMDMFPSTYHFETMVFLEKDFSN